MGLQDELNALKEKSMKMIPKQTGTIMAIASSIAFLCCF